MKTITKNLAPFLLVFLACLPVSNAETKPLKALLITGGCCHDYATQKDILKKGIEERANIIVDQLHTDDASFAPKMPFHGVADYAKGYDVVIHDECAACISDDSIVKNVLAPHKAGIPGVNLHCAMHSYRIGSVQEPVTKLGTPNSQWFEYLGLQSSIHGPKLPIAIVNEDTNHPITKKLSNWTTINEELYNNVKVFDTAHILSTGTQADQKAVVTWTNDYNGTRVFNTTIGHENETVANPNYLDLVTRGLLWACGKLEENGDIAAGFEKTASAK